MANDTKQTATWAEQVRRQAWEDLRAKVEARYVEIKALRDAGRYAEAAAVERGL